MIRLSILAIICSLLSTASVAQITAISNQDYTGCGGFLIDTGVAFNDYQNNESFTMTICAEEPETIMNLYWNTFVLGEGDSMTIYDGSDTDAPLLGVFVASDLQAADVTSSLNGCLTLEWFSDDSSTGNFSAEISCGPPCVRPVVNVEIPSTLPWRICVDEEVTLDASSTEFADGTELESFEWNFGDNSTDSISWPEVTHSFSDPGAYIVQLYVTDNNECNSGNTIDVLIQVSTTPSFDGTTENVLACLGSEVELNGAATPTEWTGAPSSNFGGALFIPDDQDQCFSSEILVSGFNADQEVQSINDLVNLFINFEHSWMGDLTMAVICPNGQSMALHSNQGGGTFLGEPVDDDELPNDAGIGFDYFWAADATNGTWGEESVGVSVLPPDTYSAVDPWDTLIGCPLNGIWELEICDNLGMDNGFIFDWAVTFDPSLYPEDLSFTPSIGFECDSTFWSSVDAPLSLDNDCNTTSTTYSETGEYVYTYHAIDNHGCEYTTDVTVEVADFSVQASEDFLVCDGQEFDLNSTLDFTGSAFENMTFQWNPSGLLDNSNSQNADSEAIGAATTYTITAFPEGFPECTDTDEVTVDVSSLSVDASGGAATCPNYEESLNALVSFSNGAFDDLVYSWSPAELVSNPNIADPTASGIGTETTFTVEVFPLGLEECAVTDEVMFTILPSPTVEATNTEWCPSQNTTLIATTGGVVDSLNWTFLDFGDYISGEATALGEFGGTYLVSVFGCGQEVFQEVEVESRPCDVFVPNVFSPDGDADGLNNTFYMIGIEFETNAHLVVYSRWGNLVYEDTNYRGNWRPSEDEASDGVYFYVLTLQDGREKNGTVTILREQ